MCQRVINIFISIWNWKQPKTQSAQHNEMEIKQKAKPDEQLGIDSSLLFEEGSQQFERRWFYPQSQQRVLGVALIIT